MSEILEVGGPNYRGTVRRRLGDWRRMPETGAKWTQEKLTDLQFLVETGGSCKIQLQNSAGNPTLAPEFDVYVAL
jgi:hypothetical protein